jgi:DNA polymerase bacteriophage-type
VFDIVNAGPRRRFTIRTNRGTLIVSNCAMAIESDILRIGLRNCERAGYGIIMHCYDEAVAEMPHGAGSVAEMERLMLDLPPEYAALPLDAHGWRKKRYRK